MSIVSHHFYAILRIPEQPTLRTSSQVLAFMRAAVWEAELETINESAVELLPHGVSAVLLLKESHVAIHTWPEYDRFTVDIHVCDFAGDNCKRAQKLADVIARACPGIADWTYQRVEDAST